MKNIIIPFLALSVFAGTQAQAVEFQTDVTSGRRWAETKTGDETTGMQISEYNVSGYAMFHPNIGAGPVLTYQQVRDVDLPEKASSDFLKVGAEVIGQYQMDYGLTPYGKIKYLLYSKGNMTGKDEGVDKYRTELETNGFNVTAGLRYNITDKFHVLGETGMGVEMIRTTKSKVELSDGTSFSDSEKSPQEDFNSRFMLVGLGMKF